METCNSRYLFSLSFALLLIFTIANCSPIASESSDDAVALPQEERTAPIARQVRVKRDTCLMGKWACVGSCMVQNCGTGYCLGGENGMCLCSRCKSGSVFGLGLGL